MSGIEFDFSEVNELAVDMSGAGVAVAKNAVTAVKTSAYRGRKMWMDAARAHVDDGTIRGYPPAIDYDNVQVSASGEIFTEIGPQIGGAGSLGIVEEAPGGVRSAPQRNREKIEQPLTEDFVRGMLIAVADGMGST